MRINSDYTEFGGAGLVSRNPLKHACILFMRIFQIFH